MKQFKYPLSISGSESELKSLVAPLEKLGYEMRNSYNGPVYKWLLTMFGGRVGNQGFNQGPDYGFGDRFTFAEKDLFLALAAMVDDDKFYEGEWVTPTRAKASYLFEGELARVRKIEDNRVYTVHQRDNDDFAGGALFRKATKEEIINHFKKGTTELAGYELIKEYPGWERDSNDFGLCSLSPEFWKPVYKAKSKTVTLRHAGGTIEVKVTKNGVSYLPENAKFTINELKHLIPTTRSVISDKCYNAAPSHIDIGCIKAIPMEDIQKVLKEFESL